MTSPTPAIVLIGGALLLALLPAKLRKAASVLLPALVLWQLGTLTLGTDITGIWGSFQVDALSLVFAWIFGITILVWAVYALHLEKRLEPVSAFLYGGSALGVVFAGDLFTLFVYWELMAIGSTGVLMASRRQGAFSAALRYVVVHFTGGVLLLCGIALRYHETGSLAFGEIGLGSASGWLIFLGFAVNAAIPPLSAWLPDAYPEGSATGSVFLSAFTTKTSVYVLATAFAGEPLLIALGAFMSLYGIFYALNENDARRVLSYSIINQVGFMVCGVGIGTPLAINGVAAHAFCHILYKSLLFMSAGAVFYRTGRTKCTELGGLWRTMPWSLAFGLVGALSISAMPFTNGFVSKPMIVEAAARGLDGGGLFLFAYIALMVASAGVSLHAGIKFPWFVFFAKDRGLRPKEAPKHMLIAMGAVSFLCIGLGLWPKPLYDILPTSVASLGFHVYTPDHVLLQFEILLASGFAFFMLLPVLKRTDTISLDTDWFYRRGARAFLAFVSGPLMGFFSRLSDFVHVRIPALLERFAKNPPGAVRLVFERFRLAAAALGGSRERIEAAGARYEALEARFEGTRPSTPWPIGRTVLYGALALFIYLALNLLR